jgi:hypothetical protein
MQIPQPVDVGKVDVVLEVRQGKVLLGRVEISQGGIDWTPAHGQKARKASWNGFAEWMMSKG